jgi:hypothetical protein
MRHPVTVIHPAFLLSLMLAIRAGFPASDRMDNERHDNMLHGMLYVLWTGDENPDFEALEKKWYGKH